MTSTPIAAKIQTIKPKHGPRIAGFRQRGHSWPVFRAKLRAATSRRSAAAGPDLTAIALAAALKADLCQIYTDVDGVYTADPRIVPGARKLDEISYDEMLELARASARR